jgi:curved DNA-binding protein CbpA
MELYDILEIKSTASEVEIKKAYLRLIKQYHPDKNNNINSIEHFQKIQSAYEILINPKSRQEYQRLNQKEKFSFVEILDKIINNIDNITEYDIKSYGINLEKTDYNYIQKNIVNFFSGLNISELLSFFTKGIVPRKEPINLNNYSESDIDIYEESHAEYFYYLPLCCQKHNKLDIKIDLTVNIGDITSSNKKKIKIKRKIEDEESTTTFLFNLSKPYIVFIGGGDMDDGNYGNLIIKLNLQNNLIWEENLILIEQSMSLYELIYGLDIYLDLGNDNIISINHWVPSRDGYLIDITNNKIPGHNLAIKLYLDYENTQEKALILQQYFS